MLISDTLLMQHISLFSFTLSHSSLSRGSLRGAAHQLQRGMPLRSYTWSCGGSIVYRASGYTTTSVLIVMGTLADPVKELSARKRESRSWFHRYRSLKVVPRIHPIDDLKPCAVVINSFHEILKVVERRKLRPAGDAKFAQIYVIVPRWVN